MAKKIADRKPGEPWRTSIYIDTEWMAMVDQWRAAQKDVPHRNEAIKRMVREAYLAHRKKLKRTA